MKKKRVLTIVSGAPSGALHVAQIIATYLQQFYQSELLLRKYNKANLDNVTVVKDNFVIDYIWQLCEQLARIKPDLILVHGYSTHLWTKIAATIHQVPVVHIEHNVEKYTSFRRWLLKKLDKYTTAYICVSRGVANHLIAQGADSNKVKVIYNGIEIEKFAVEKTSHDTFTIGMTARFSSQKDHLTLIKAVENLIKSENLPIQLILQGTGKQKARCVQYVEQQGLQHVIFFETGTFIELAKKIDLFVLATHYEGLPLVICEAMGAKVPVIAANVAGIDEIIEHGVNGYMVAAEDYKALANQIFYCYQRREQMEARMIIDDAYNSVNQKFTHARMVKHYQKFIAKVLRC